MADKQEKQAINAPANAGLISHWISLNNEIIDKFISTSFGIVYDVQGEVNRRIAGTLAFATADMPTEQVNMVFRAHRYGPDHPALAGRDLDPRRYSAANGL